MQNYVYMQNRMQNNTIWKYDNPIHTFLYSYTHGTNKIRISLEILIFVACFPNCSVPRFKFTQLNAADW